MARQRNPLRILLQLMVSVAFLHHSAGILAAHAQTPRVQPASCGAFRTVTSACGVSFYGERTRSPADRCLEEQDVRALSNERGAGSACAEKRDEPSGI
jgi:hypothetical protein